MLNLRSDEQKELHKKSSLLRNSTIGNNLFFRGLIEISNICQNNCYYCGIGKSNKKIKRYDMSQKEILKTTEIISELGFSSIVIQTGERHDEKFIAHICETLQEIKNQYPHIVITLSIGEQKKEIYKHLYESGAERYLLRIESSNKDLYERIHPKEMSYKERIQCLEDLKKIGFQVGSGVMIHLPEQSIEDLADDILFLNAMDIDMCGMGPYIPHKDASLVHEKYNADEAVNLSLNMISALRLTMRDINIAATTALEALSTRGREYGLKAGANVIMPQFSPVETRKDYMLYNNKPIDTSDGINLIEELKILAESCTMTAVFDNAGNSLHYQRRIAILF